MGIKSHKFIRLITSRWLPWVFLGIVILAAMLFLVSQPALMRSLPRSNQFGIGAIILIVFLFAYLMLNRVMDLYDQREKLQQRLQDAEKQGVQSYRRLEAIFQVGQKYVEATDENEVIELVLKLSVEMAGAKGASFVPLDEHSQPMTSTSYGDLPNLLLGPWLEYLSSPAMRARCKSCEQHEKLTVACPLLKGPISDAAEIFCIPLRHREQEFGVLNLYMPGTSQLDNQTRAFLGAIVDETALALDGVRLRRRELAALRQMQTIRQKADLRALLNGLLESVHQSLDADTSVLLVRLQPASTDFNKLVLGELSAQLHPFIDGVMRGVIESGKPVILGDVVGDPGVKSDLRSFMSVPLTHADRTVIGSILVGNRRAQSFNQRQLVLLQTVAGQFSLVVQNSSLFTELEFQAMMEERKRLAREIHDGLAQTLGFLKLQAAQMKNYLARGEYERVSSALEQYHTTLSEAYQDARQSIDGLRIGMGENGLRGWLEKIVSEFQEISNFPIILRKVTTNANLAPEVHAQLIRVVQEALSNVRKHSQASQVWIECFEQDGDLWLEIQDDGIGFSPEDVSGSSRHGLLGMRERVELIGADFQVVSLSGEGTTIRIRLPLQPAVAEASG